MLQRVELNARKILVVDDDQDNLKLMSRLLTSEKYLVDIAVNGEEALNKLAHTKPDLVLLDINMPGVSGLEVLKILRARESFISVIFISARSKSEDIIKGLDLGADDYICKPYDPYEMLARVRAQFRIKDLTDRLATANQKLQELVDVDDLTGLYNMRSIFTRIEVELVRARRYGRQVAIVMMDMDNFKNINDNFDHVFGSFVLASVGRIIRDTIRQVDFAARYGGDEFLIVLTETGLDGALKFSERLRQVIAENEFKSSQFSSRLTASVGIAVSSTQDTQLPAKELVRCADHALYEAKRSGKNCVKIYSSDLD